MLQWILTQIQSVGFDVSDLRKIELASEEALVNSIKHGYKDNPNGIVELTLNVYKNEKIELIIKDKGVSFNPLIHETKFDLQSTLEQRKEGGLGIFMMRQYMDQIMYNREGQFNFLTMIKKITY